LTLSIPDKGYYRNISCALGHLWPWSYGSWIYNYMCNQCLSPPKSCEFESDTGGVYLNIMW